MVVEAPPSSAERAAMQRALELARRGWGRVAPNPLVGAVVLQGDAVVGEGYHAEYGGPHAAGVARVVAALGDPDPRAGGGAELLRARGVTVVLGLLAQEAAALNAPFLF